MIAMLKRIYKNLTRPHNNNHDFTEIDRERASMARQELITKKKQIDLLNHRLEHLKFIQQVRSAEEAIAQFEEVALDPDESADEKLLTLVSNIFAGAPPQQDPQQGGTMFHGNTQNTQIQPQGEAFSLNSDQLKALREVLPQGSEKHLVDALVKKGTDPATIEKVRTLF